MVKFNSSRFMLKVSPGSCLGEPWTIRSRKRMSHDLFGPGIDQSYCAILCDSTHAAVTSLPKYFIS